MATKIMVFGVGSFAHSVMSILKEQGAEVSCYLTRDYGHYGPASIGQCWNVANHPDPMLLVEEYQPDYILPMSIAWNDAPWASKLIESKYPILCPYGEALRIERERDFAYKLCQQTGVPFPKSYTVGNRLEAFELMNKDPRPYVLKNPLCSPFSPIHTVVCETIEDTLGWLQRTDYAEGAFLQEYLGTAEVGHFVWVSGGEIISLVTNQEYKRAFTGNMGPVAGAPLGGLVEQDPDDHYGLAAQLIHPLHPWLKEVGYQGPLQVTAIKKDEKWHAIEYNVRLGVTSGAMILRMLENPLEVLYSGISNTKVEPKWNKNLNYGCSVTLAGFGYPYTVPVAPQLPVLLQESPDCDLWWNEVDEENGNIFMAHHEVPMMGHRIADVIAINNNLTNAIEKAYRNISKIRCLGSYYRQDIGQSLWPPGTGY